MYTFFFSETSPFSQWHRCAFLVDGATARAVHENEGDPGAMYNCAEQCMMHHKAKLFGDQRSAMKILLADHPSEQKALGRTIRGFNEAVWVQKREIIVYTANQAKFTQNPELLYQLLATRGTTLVEASPYDKIWGIGLTASDPRAQDATQWLGQNLLGKILTRLRDDLLDKVKLALVSD